MYLFPFEILSKFLENLGLHQLLWMNNQVQLIVLQSGTRSVTGLCHQPQIVWCHYIQRLGTEPELSPYRFVSFPFFSQEGTNCQKRRIRQGRQVTRERDTRGEERKGKRILSDYSEAHRKACSLVSRNKPAFIFAPRETTCESDAMQMHTCTYVGTVHINRSTGSQLDATFQGHMWMI